MKYLDIMDLYVKPLSCEGSLPSKFRLTELT